MKPFHTASAFCLSLVLLCSACRSEPTDQIQPPEQLKTPTLAPTSAGENQSTPPQTGTGEENPLPPDPLDVVFFSEDGQELKGQFFPAASLEQPVLVLMHWFQGDQRDWEEIAYWLQNRGRGAEREGVPWLDSSWFPALPPDASYNVLIFTFRDCVGGCTQPHPEGWLRDARASLIAARSLQGVDPNQVISIGASIGGDAAISSCASALEMDSLACLGSLSFSPGSYLGESYPELVTQLGSFSPPRPAWCLYGQSDPDAGVCTSAGGSNFYAEGWQGGNLHGMHLISSTLDPLPLSKLLEFLELVSGN